MPGRPSGVSKGSNWRSIPASQPQAITDVANPVNARAALSAHCSLAAVIISRVAFIGNSYQYYNDLPRLFQVLTVADDGRNKFSSRPASRSPGGSYDIGAPTVSDLLTARGPWDALIINDYS